VRTVCRRHVVGHQLQILPQRALRPPRHDPPEPQPSAAGRSPDGWGPLGPRGLSRGPCV
jgi:hypothetical protein